MAETMSGIVEAVSNRNNSFKLQNGDWYKLGKGVNVEITSINKGDSMDFEYNPSEYNGKVTNWVNKLFMGMPEEPELTPPADDPREETPPIGKYGSKKEMNRTEFNILYGMCLNNVINNSPGKKDWEKVLSEVEQLVVDVMLHRENMWEKVRDDIPY